MKKFISFGAAIALLVFVSNCREADEIVAIKKYTKVAFIVDTGTLTHIQYFDFSAIQDNQDVIERVFDWGIATPQVTYTFGGGVGNGGNITSYKFDFNHPTATAVNMYGIAKKNGGWHGAKLIVK